MVEVVLYTKPGCHLCETVERTIHDAAGLGQFHFIVRDILDNDDDFARYELDIPVVTMNGREIARHRLGADVFARALALAAEGR